MQYVDATTKRAAMPLSAPRTLKVAKAAAAADVSKKSRNTSGDAMQAAGVPEKQYTV